MSPEVTAYLERLHGQLHLDPAVEAEIVRELQDHLQDCTDELVRGGVPERQAWSMGLARFGRAEAVAHSFQDAHRDTAWVSAVFGGAAFALPGILLGFGLWANPFISLAAALCVLIVVGYGLRQGRPLWFYPWAAVALIPPFIVGYLAFDFLSHQLGALGSVMSLATLAEITGAAIYFPFAGVGLAVLILLVVRRDWLDASLMLAAIPPTLAWLIELQTVRGLPDPEVRLHDPSALIGSVFIAMAAAAVVVLRGRRRSLRVASLFTAAVLLVFAPSVMAGAGVLSMVVIWRIALLLIFLLVPALTRRYSWREAV